MTVGGIDLHLEFALSQTVSAGSEGYTFTYFSCTISRNG